MTDFYDLIDTDDLDDREEERLRRAHDLLVQAGPPPDLPPALQRPPTEKREAAEIIEFPLLPRRRAGAARFSPLPSLSPRSAAATCSGTRRPSRARSRPNESSRCTQSAPALHLRSPWSRSRAPTPTATRARLSGHRPREAADGQLLRALADEQRQAVGLMRHVPRPGPHDDGAVLRPVPPEPLQRLGRDRRDAGPSRSRPDGDDYLKRPQARFR